MTLIVACGLQREARIFKRGDHHVIAVVGGGDAARLACDLDDMAELFPGVIVSSGVAGALDPALRPGDVVIDGDPGLVERLARAIPTAVVGPVIGSDTIVASVMAKQALRRESGALAVDMETHVARRVATRRQWPFVVLRTISDCADHALPPAALVGMKPDGGMALGAVLASLARDPRQLPALLRTGRDAGRAFKALAAAFQVLRNANFDQFQPLP